MKADRKCGHVNATHPNTMSASNALYPTRRGSQYLIASDKRSRNGAGSEGAEPGALLAADVFN